ncbi:MAG: phospholipase D family protein [Burkholderiales bacterium]|nr:phospholipase D family protein [Burkholderiales bacterium]
MFNRLSSLRLRSAWGALLLGAAVALAGCARLPKDVDRPDSKAPPPAVDTALGRIAKASTVDPEQSGFRLMPTGQYALQARIELARRAQRTLDVQYYQIYDDRTGRYLLRTLRDASERGVRVRLIIDDLYTSGQDPLLMGLDAYPNVEVRLFNPFPAGRQNFLTRFTVNIHDFDRVHRRMHNKLFLADSVMAVVGGRNIADEYFMASAGANFIDLDTFVIGSIMPRLGALFDEYWNSDRVMPIRAIVKTDQSDEQLRAYFERRTSAEAVPVLRVIESPAETGLPPTVEVIGETGGTPEPERPPPNDVLGYGPIVNELNAGKVGLIWADAQAYADAPDKVIGRVSTYGIAPIDDVDSVRYNVIEMMRRARKDVVLTSPYLVPGADGLEVFRNSVERYGVKYTLVTNSLAATDEPVVHTGYRRYRPEMLKLGMNLYELSPQKVSRSLRLGRFSTSIGRLHAKSAVVDGERVFIGSMNFDPRSNQHNTEFGLFIQSPQIAQQVLKLVDVIRQQGAYKVTLAENGKDLVWTTSGPGGAEQIVEEPETDAWSRLMLEVLSVLVPEGLL